LWWRGGRTIVKSNMKQVLGTSIARLKKKRYWKFVVLRFLVPYHTLLEKIKTSSNAFVEISSNAFKSFPVTLLMMLFAALKCVADSALSL
jgi:hypothetical protein